MKQGFFKKFDLFSQEFSFFVGHDKKKSTAFGGMLSIIIYLVSLIFLVYLLNLYFGNKFIPKIALQTFNEQNNQELTFNESLFAFQVIAYGKLLAAYEYETNKKYLQFQIIQTSYENDGSSIIKQIPIKECEIGSLQEGFMCIDLDNQPIENKTLFIDPSRYVNSSYSLIVSQCQGLPECATPQEITDMVVNQSTSMFIKTIVEEYDCNSKKLEKITKLDYFNFDDQLVISSTFNIQRQITKVESGIIFQQKEEYEHQIGYQKVERYFSQSNMLNKLGYEGYACVSFQLDQTYSVMTIQFPMITEVLSQFMSIFNILIFFGISAQILAKSKMVEDVNSLFLKEYYKKTALKLIENNNINNNKKKKIIPFIQQESISQEQKKSTAKDIQILQEEIDGLDLLKRQKEIFKVSFFSRIKTIIFGIFNKNTNKLSEEQIIFQEIISKTVKQIDIYEVVRDLIKLKIAIKLLLSKDQYAALQYCGCELQIKDQKNENQIGQLNELQKDKQLKQDEINNSYHKEEDILWNNNLDKKLQIQKDDQDQFKSNIKLSSKDSTISLSPLKSQQILSKTQIGNSNEISSQNKIAPFYDYNNEDQIIDPIVAITSQRTSRNKIINNHLQEIDEISNNKNEMQKQLEIFISRVEQQGKYLSQIDQNIYSSLICKVQNYYSTNKSNGNSNNNNNINKNSNNQMNILIENNKINNM